ncbi:amidase [Microbaculum marinisediminis]|uniref:Amidase family protein n=1 Tax=Microbaculum marinisediminis TaxID=2931392 RepID=A0AAW5R2P1_9HYPH|nr:amidase family protein [Microbaculum sp. A6E488]MCT8973379.1 amidase family protein [Microbaculum sp. A6E488]
MSVNFDKNAEIGYLTAIDLKQAYTSGALSAKTVTEQILDRIAELNPELNAFSALTADQAMQDAANADAQRAEGRDAPLLGIPVTIKDAYDLAGVKTETGSIWLSETSAVADADNVVVKRLRDAGAVVLGKTTTSEMAWSGLSWSPLTGTTHNPWGKGLNAGASSAGAGVAAAAGFGPLHLGSDGGGSIRMPCHFCGVFGLKPTFGRVPHVPMSNNDYATHIGPMSKTVADSALMLKVMAGPHHLDHTCCESSPPDYLASLPATMKGKRIALSVDLGHARVDDDVAASVREAAKLFSSLGANVEEVTPSWGEKGADLARFFWAAKEGRRANLIEEWGSKLGADYVACMRAGAEYSAPEFLNRRQEKYDYVAEMQSFFEDWDFLLTPTASVTAFPPQQMRPDHWPQHEWDWMAWAEFLYPFNLSGNPAASVPCGFDGSGLPIGLQIVGRRFDDLGVLQASAAYEASNPIYRQRPSFDSFR